MAQEFRTITQRVTDERSRRDRILNRGGTRVFNVRAKTLVDQFGNDVVDAKGEKIWFPETFDPNAAIAFGKSLRRLPFQIKAAAMLFNFVRGGPFVPANDSLFPDTKTSFADRFGDRASSGFNDGPGKRTSDAFSPGFYNDELPEAWLFRALTGRLR